MRVLQSIKLIYDIANILYFNNLIKDNLELFRIKSEIVLKSQFVVACSFLYLNFYLHYYKLFQVNNDQSCTLYLVL